MNKRPVRKRMTKQKQLIYDTLNNTRSHPTADWIYERAQEVMPGISLGTVYRNLQVLQEEGRIRELNFGKARFDAKIEPHHHFVCRKCQKVIDVENVGELLSAEVFGKLPGVADGYHLDFYGCCHDCRNGLS